MRAFRGPQRCAALAGVFALPFLLSCGGHSCGLGLHDRTSVGGNIACCGASVRNDVALRDYGDSEFDLTNTVLGNQPVDVFLVPSTCDKLFDGTYPGAPPLCEVLVGPATPGNVAPRKRLKTGTYRIWVQAHSSNTAAANFLVEIGSWDYRCVTPVQ